MKFILILLFAGMVSNAQIQKEQLNLLPWPQNINLTEGTFALSKSFKINITGEPNGRIFIGATNFLRRLDGRTGLFLEQAFLTKTNEYPEAELQINCTRNGKIEINEDESYRLTVTSSRIAIDATTDLGALHGL